MSRSGVHTKIKFDSYSFGREVHTRMRQKHMNHTELGKETGVPQETLSRITMGKMPSVPNLTALLYWGGWEMRQFMIAGTEGVSHV